MAYIEKEPLCAWLENMGVSDIIIRRIKSEAHFPTADVVEVVRCKGCKHQEQCCEFIMISGKDKNIEFCSGGERRPDNDL